MKHAPRGLGISSPPWNTIVKGSGKYSLVNCPVNSDDSCTALFLNVTCNYFMSISLNFIINFL